MQYNPQYGKQDENPTWSLAQPLPHIVRPGMQHGALPEDRQEDKEGMKPGHGSTSQNAQDKSDDGFFNTWSQIRHLLREPLAEWLGVGLLRPIPNSTTGI